MWELQKGSLSFSVDQTVFTHCLNLSHYGNMLITTADLQQLSDFFAVENCFVIFRALVIAGGLCLKKIEKWVLRLGWSVPTKFLCN